MMTTTETAFKEKVPQVRAALRIILEAFTINRVPKEVGVSAMVTYIVTEVFGEMLEQTHEERVKVISEFLSQNMVEVGFARLWDLPDEA